MIRRLIILLLIVGCEEVLESIKDGCTTSTACNYDETATVDNNSCDFTSCLDCLGYQNGIAVLDSCGVCDAAPQNDCAQDCVGTWGGTAIIDSCGNCSTSTIICDLDCNGEWGGSAVVDACDVCGGSATSTNDCTVCDAGLTLGCDGICSATPAVNDVCDICGGDGSKCKDCAGTVNGSATTDNCDVCDTDSSNDCSQDCNGTWGGSVVLDNCGICGGDNSDCTDCLGEVGGSATVDTCGTCDTDITNDCIQDVCGVWNGDNSTCIIDLEFAIIKSFEQTNWVGHLCFIPVCEDGIEPDCACICGGDAIEQTYYWDSDGDGLGAGDGELQCNGFDLNDGWVSNDDDDDDTIAICYIFYTLNILEEDLEITNGNLAFSYNEEDYSIDVSSCVHIGDINVTNIIQNTALKVITVKFDADTSMPFNYSTPNELMFSLPQ